MCYMLNSFMICRYNFTANKCYTIILKLNINSRIPWSLCATIGYFLYFSGFAMFCWMALLSFDLYWTFRNLKLPNTNPGCSVRLLTYIFIGTGIPLAMTSALLIVDHFKIFKILPGVGEESCFLTIQGIFYFHFFVQRKPLNGITDYFMTRLM